MNDADVSALMDTLKIEKAISQSASEINFWQAKLDADTGSFVNMLQLGFGHLGFFKISGEVHHLDKGQWLFTRASEKLRHTDPEILQVLSQLAITRHRFREGADYNKQAQRVPASPYVSALLDFDALIELGSYWEAEKKLSTLPDGGSFDYLIRRSRLEDIKGKSDEAISTMERPLSEFVIEGVKTTIPFHLKLMKDPNFRAGNFTTKFMETFVFTES